MTGQAVKAAAVAVILAVALAAAVLSLSAGGQQAGGQGAPAVTAVVTTPGGESTFTQGPGGAVGSSSCTGSTETYGNMTLVSSPCVTYGFPTITVKNATLDTRPVLTFIRTAYEYHIVYCAFSRTDPNVMYAVLNVTGRQVVAGNYTAGYQVSYVANRLLNVTVLQVVRSTYDVTHVSSYPLPDRNTTVDYTPQQVKDIQIALSNSTFNSLMTNPPYYVEDVGAFGVGPENGSSLVQLYQVDGTGVAGAIVNPILGTVTRSFISQSFSGECWPNGVIITDPWDATSYSSCVG